MPIASILTLATALLAAPPANPNADVPRWRVAGFTSHADYVEAARRHALEHPCMMEFPPEGPTQGNHKVNLWPTGIIPFEFGDNVTDLEMQRTLDAMAELKATCGVEFVPRVDEVNYVTVIEAAGNSAGVGMVGGQQFVRIGSSSWIFHYIIVHELFHTLGVMHEQQRPDQDDFVQINFGNIIPGLEFNFTVPPDVVAFGPYDFDSVMHYGQCAFSVCTCPGCPTITVLPPNEEWQELIGQRDHLSEGDIALVQHLYPGIPDDAYEHNDDFDEAAPLGGGVHDDLILIDAVDYYELTMTGPGNLIVFANFDSADMDLNLVLYDENEVPVSFSFGVGDFELVTATVTEASTYVLRAQRDGGMGGDYQLDVTGPPVNACDADIDDDGLVGFDDLLLLLADWGPCPGCVADINGDDSVDFDDLLLLLADWGEC